MLGGLLAYPFALVFRRSASAFAFIGICAALTIAVDVTAVSLGADLSDPAASGARVAQLVSGLLQTLFGAMVLSLGLQERGRRHSAPSVGDGVTLIALGVQYSLACALPIVLAWFFIAGAIKAFAPAPLGNPAALAVSVLLAFVLVFVTCRLSFAGPQSLVGGRLVLFRAWPLTRGRFWAILGLNLAAIAAATLIAVATLAPAFFVLGDPLIATIAIDAATTLLTFYFYAAQAFIFDQLAPPPTDSEVADH